MLPRMLVSVGPQLERLREFRRLRATEGFVANMSERDYDRFFASCLDVIESLLRESGDIAEDSRLKLLSQPGEQVARLDLLLAEVGPDDEEFRRLVIVEDKLSTNREGRRQVLAQVLEYSQIVQSSLTPDDLPDAVADWTEEYRDDIQEAMRSGDFLLIICGNEIHDSLVRLVKSYLRRIDPTNLSSMVLIALPVYSDGAAHIVVPHVVGGIERSTRDLTLRVEVHTEQAERLTVSRTYTQSTPRRVDTGRSDRVVDPDEFMVEWERRCGRDAGDAWRQFVDRVRAAAIPGFFVGNYPSGAPYVGLRETLIGPVQVIRLSSTSPEVRDRLSGRAWNSSTQLRQARDGFRMALLDAMTGRASIRGEAGRVYAPVKLLAANADRVASAIATFASGVMVMDGSGV